MKSYDCASWFITIYLLLSPANCSVTKRRLCIKYKKENFLADSRYIIIESRAETENMCMISCMRRDPCMAFNYHVIYKTCILMPQFKCMAPSSLNNTSYLFVCLQSCKLQPVWFSVRPEESNWQWVAIKDPRKNANVIKIPGPNARYVSRTLYQGYYLPGWWLPIGGPFRTVDPVSSTVTRCRYGEFLAFADASSYCWVPYTAGASLPDCALPISELPDGTPLYIVRHGFDTISGFYNHLTQSTYFVYWGVVNPKAVDILCSNTA